MEIKFSAEILTAAEEHVSSGQAWFVPDSNLGTFVPEDGEADPAAKLLAHGTALPVALSTEEGRVHKIDGIEKGDWSKGVRCFFFRC